MPCIWRSGVGYIFSVAKWRSEFEKQVNKW
jgi:hypothetical protein